MPTLAETAARLKPQAPTALPRLILMTDSVRLPEPEPAVAALPRGAAVVLRHYDDPDRAALARRLAALCRRRGIRLLIGADAHLALAVDAAGLHLPEGLVRHGGRAWRTWRRPGWLVTAAAHSLGAVLAAERAGVDAVLLSPVFATASHPDAGEGHILGPLRFARLVHASPLPTYALGGISPATAGRLRGSGAVGIAAISALSRPVSR